MHPAFQEVQHRPWPVPQRRWLWRQSWHDLLFVHWPVPASRLKPFVPPGLRVQEYEGSSWIGVVPFHMSGVAPRLLPNLPGLSAFPELNVRIYVERSGRPGVWFLSLDAGNRLAVIAARRWFHLPYHYAQMSVRKSDGTVSYTSRRMSNPAGLRFVARYRATGASYRAKTGTLDAWLTERYCLYSQSSKGQLYRAEIHHAPWNLQPAEAEIERNELFDPYGLRVDGKPLLYFALRVDVVVWGLEPV